MPGQVPLVLLSAEEHQMNRSLLVCSGGPWLFQKCQAVWSHRSNILGVFISGHCIIPLSSSFSCGPTSYTCVSDGVNNSKRHINNQQTAEVFLPRTFLNSLPSKG